LGYRVGNPTLTLTPRRRAQLTFEPNSTPQQLVIKGRLRPAVRFESPGNPKVANLQRRNATALRTLGELDYLRSSGHEARSAVQTCALAGGTAVDHIRVEVRPRRLAWRKRGTSGYQALTGSRACPGAGAESLIRAGRRWPASARSPAALIRGYGKASAAAQPAASSALAPRRTSPPWRAAQPLTCSSMGRAVRRGALRDTCTR